MSLLPLDDRDGVIWLNGNLVPWREAKIHVLSHSLHYGSAVFEGERVYGGKVFKLTEHSTRLLASGKLLAMDIPYTVAELDAATRLVVSENKLDSGYVRPIAWRGAEVIGASAHGTYLGVEGGLSVSFVRFTMGVSKRLEEKAHGADVLFTWGVGVQIRMGGSKQNP